MDRGGVVLVTGVGQGFGRAVALGWGRAGYDVVCADRDVALASKTAAEIEEAGGQAIPIQIDVTVPLDVRHAFEKIDELFGALDGVVHVATRASHSSAADLTDGEFAELVDETLRSSQLVLRTATRLLESAWIVLVTPAASADAPQNEMVRGGMARLAAAYGARYPAFRVNAIVPSRSASDPQHDAPVVEAALWLGSDAGGGVGGLELPVLLPPPPRVTEALLPEIQAALDDRVRQDDLEAELWNDGEDDDEDEEDDLEAIDDDENLDDDAFDEAPEAGAARTYDPVAGARDRRRAPRSGLGELNDENRPPDHLLGPDDGPGGEGGATREADATDSDGNEFGDGLGDGGERPRRPFRLRP